MNLKNQRMSTTPMLARAFATAFGTLIVGAMLSFSARAQSVVSGENGILTGLPNFAVYLTISVGVIFILNSFVTAFSAYDRETRELFLSDSPKNIYFGESLRDILSSKTFLIEAAATVGIISILAAVGGFSYIGRVFFEDGRWSRGWFPVAVLAPIAFLLLLFSKYEARRYWVSLLLIGEVEEKLERPWRFVGRMAVIVLLYPIVFPLSPLLVYMVWNFIAVIIQLTNAFTLLGTVLGIIGLITIVYIIGFISASRKRKKFLKAISLICHENAYELTPPRRPYYAIFRTRPIYFSIKAEGKLFTCTLLPCLHRRTPFVINSATGGYFRHRIGTKNHHYSINHNIDFFPPSEGEHLVILSPTPKEILISEGKYENKLTSGDRLWDFILYSDASFASALDRKCLGRANKDK